MSTENIEPEQQKRKRNVKSVDVDNYTLEKSNNYIGEGKKFGSFSGMMNTALNRLIFELEMGDINESAMTILLKMLKTPEGKLAFDKITAGAETPNTNNQDDKTVLFSKDIPRKLRLD